MKTLFSTVTVGALFLAFFASFSHAEGPRPTALPEVSGPDVSAVGGFDYAFEDEIQRDFTLRSLGALEVTNMRGDIELRGWALDKIRVVIRRRARAETQGRAQALAQALDVRFQPVEKHLELSVEYGKNLPLADRIRERARPQTEASMTVWGPSNLVAKVWATRGNTRVFSWSAPLEVRSSEGRIHVEQIRGESVSLLCLACAMEVRNVRASLRVMGGSGKVELFGIQGSPVYVETATGDVRFTRVHGEQLYVTQSGNLAGQDLHGGIEFHSGTGAVRILDSSGSLSGRSESGSIFATFRAWKFRDKSIVETVSGAVDLALPADFSGDLELFSGVAKPQVAASVRLHRPGSDETLDLDAEAPAPTIAYGPQKRDAQLIQVAGRVGNGGEVLRVVSRHGAVRLRRFDAFEKK